VNEVFGPTVQGEGPHVGQRCAFVRLADCNLACTWCDTRYSWDWAHYDRDTETHEMTPAEVAAAVTEMGVDRLVLTGGEPLMQQHALHELHDALAGIPIDVETNGTITPHPSVEHLIDLFVVSPKLAHAGDRESKRLKNDPMLRFAALSRHQRAVFKFVVATPDDIAEAAGICDRYRINRSVVWLMPEGASRADHLDHLVALADPIIAAGFHLSTRLHVLAWDTERGV
jgi:organic radical activating enzyme